MTRHLTRAILALCAAIVVAGCSLLPFKKHPPKPPEAPPAAAIQEEYRSRWIEKRVHELMAATPGTTDAEARRIANGEFSKQHPYITPTDGASAR
jgi:hypothetical protein